MIRGAGDRAGALPYDGGMSPGLLESLALACPIVTAEPGVAGPCAGYDPCERLDFWSSLEVHNAAKIPTDGVLVLRGVHRGGWDDHVLEHIDLGVTRDGQPIAGALERSSASGVLVWRPTAAWTAGATYQLHAAVSNPVEVADTFCAPVNFELDADLIVDSEPGGVLAPPTFTGVEEQDFGRVVTLENLACCEGEVPESQASPCGPGYLAWETGACFTTVGIGYLAVDLTVTPPELGPVAGQLLSRSIVNGQPGFARLVPTAAYLTTVSADKPMCITIEIEDLATHEVARGPERCFGEAVADELGPRPIELPEHYYCQLQRCELTDGAWDLERCTPLSVPVEAADEAEGDEDMAEARGCGCDASSAAGLGLLVLPGLRRRRRAH